MLGETHFSPSSSSEDIELTVVLLERPDSLKLEVKGFLDLDLKFSRELEILFFCFRATLTDSRAESDMSYLSLFLGCARDRSGRKRRGSRLDSSRVSFPFWIADRCFPFLLSCSRLREDLVPCLPLEFLDGTSTAPGLELFPKRFSKYLTYE